MPWMLSAIATTSGIPSSAARRAARILNQYTRGAVIWAVPYWGYVTDDGI